MTDGAAPLLPPPFEDLEPLAGRWARATEDERSAIRHVASADDFRTLYDTLAPRFAQILDHLRRQPASGLEGGARRLFELACAFVEAAPHHELYRGSAQVPHSFDPRRLVASHGGNPD
jgi:hypothetical protein